MTDPRAYDGRVQECVVCHAHVLELRRGRCWGCYARWTEARPVGIGARCVTCDEQRRRLLRSIELYGGWRPMCFNCGGQLGGLQPMPRTLAALRDALSRDRRKRDRRIGKSDTRVYQYERRVGERRCDGRLDLIDDDMIVEITIEPAVAGDGDDFDALTQIRELVRDLRPVASTG